jgi:hypothetical protein
MDVVHDEGRLRVRAAEERRRDQRAGSAEERTPRQRQIVMGHAFLIGR